MAEKKKDMKKDKKEKDVKKESKDKKNVCEFC